MFSPNAQAGPSRQPELTSGPESGRDDSPGLKRQSSTQEHEQDNRKKRRKTYSCTECHRLKSKCDRQIPCGACIKRETTDECSLWSKLAPKPDHQRPYAEIQAQYAHVPVPVANPHYQRKQQLSAMTTTPPPNASYRDRSQSHGQQSVILAPQTEHTRAPPSLSMLVTSGTDSISPLAQTTPIVTQTMPRVPAAQSRNPAGDLAIADKARQLATAVSFERGIILDAGKESAEHNDDEDDDSDERDGMETGHGTLMIDDHGRSFFLGSTAGSEWLREPEEDTMTPYPVGGRRAGFGNAGHIGMAPTAPQSLFPFPIANMDPLTAVEMMLKQLPERTEAKVLANCYFRHMAWHYTLVDRKSFDEDAEIIYAASYAREPSMSMFPNPTRKEPKLDQLALFFSVLAVGAQYNLELPPNDPISSHYCSLAQCCLSMANFMVQNTIYGVQTLHLMGHFFLSHDQRGDSTWPLWGLLMRIVQAMGLHRDGSRWGLPPDIVDQRRRVFWECHAAEVLQAACFSRPNCIQADQIDTEFPLEETTPTGEMGFINLRNKLILIALPALRQVLSVRKPSYNQTQKIWRELIEFERNIPYHLRCKPAWSAIVSLSQTQEGGATVAPDAPEVVKHDFPLTFQQHALALNVTETVLSLNRMWFLRGLCDTTKELSESKYYPSVLAVFERCLALSAITQSLTTLFPALAYRHWYFWHHAFGACTAFSTVIIVRPTCFLAPFAMAEINTIVDLFAGAPPGSRPRTSLDSLIKIQRRAQERLNAKTAPPNNVLDDMTATFGVVPPDPSTPGDDDEDKHIPMMGWDTRLVRMLKAGAQRGGVAISRSVPRSEAGKAKQTPPNSASPSVSATATVASVEPTTTAGTTAPASVSCGDQPITFDFEGATPVTNQDWDFWMDWIKTCGSSNPDDFAHF